MHVFGPVFEVICAVLEIRCGTTGFEVWDTKTVGAQQVCLNCEFRNSEGFRLQIENRL